MLLDILPPTYSYLQGGLFGGMLGALLGWLIRNNSLRWLMTFSMLGLISSVMFSTLEQFDAVRVHSEIKFFIPAFIIIGGLIGDLIRRKDSPNNWHWIPAFSLLGAVTASISQIRGEVQTLIVIGLVLGAIVWQVTNVKMRWTLAFAIFGAMLSWLLLSDSFATRSSFDSAAIIFAIGGIVATAVSWSIDDSNIRWVLTFAMIGGMCGSMLNWFSNSFPLTLLVGLTISGVVALVVIPLKIRDQIAFIGFAALGLCWIAAVWHFIRFWERVSPLL